MKKVVIFLLLLLIFTGCTNKKLDNILEERRSFSLISDIKGVDFVKTELSVRGRK